MELDFRGLLVISALVLISYYLSRKNIRERKSRVANLASFNSIDFPVIIPMKPWSQRNRLGSLLAVLFIVFPFYSAICFFAIYLLNYKYGNMHENTLLVAALLCGAIATVLISQQLPELNKINSDVALLTLDRELIIQRNQLKISRGMYPGRMAARADDEANYYVIPTGGSMSVEHQVQSGRFGWRVFYVINDRNRSFALSSEQLDKNEIKFVSAMKTIGVQTIDF